MSNFKKNAIEKREQERKEERLINSNHPHYMMYINKLKEAISTYWVSFLILQQRTYL